MSEFRVTAISKLHAEFSVPGRQEHVPPRRHPRRAVQRHLHHPQFPAQRGLREHAQRHEGARRPPRSARRTRRLRPDQPAHPRPVDETQRARRAHRLRQLRHRHAAARRSARRPAFTSELFGDASLSSRPMGRITVPLGQMGANIETRGEKPGCAPLRIHAAKLTPITYDMPVASAQVKSAVLLAGMFAEGKTTVIQPAETRDHTERMLASFRVSTRREGNAISIDGGQIPQVLRFHRARRHFQRRLLAGRRRRPARLAPAHQGRRPQPDPHRHPQGAQPHGRAHDPRSSTTPKANRSATSRSTARRSTAPPSSNERSAQSHR